MSIIVDTTKDKKASQKVWIDGKLVSSQTDTMDGYPAYLYSSNECYKNQCGSINAYCKLPLEHPPIRRGCQAPLMYDLVRPGPLSNLFFLSAWDNVTITLNEADESFGKSVQLTGATGSFSTSDNGKTWTGTVKIDADHFPA